MEEGRYRHLPIIDDGKVVEIVSRFDFSGLLSRIASTRRSASGKDLNRIINP